MKPPAPVDHKPPFIAKLHAEGKWLITKPELPPIDLRVTKG